MGLRRTPTFVVLAVAAAASMVAACGSTDSASVGNPTPDPGSTTSPTAGPDASESGDPADAWSTVVAFNEALVARDWAAAGELAEPGSPAAGYVTYREAVSQAQQSAGLTDASTGRVVGDEESGQVTVTLSTDDDEVSYTWDDFEVGSEGLVSSWSTEVGPLSDILVTPDASAEAAGATVTWTHAYVTLDSQLYVVVRLDAQDDLITPDDSIGLRTGDDTVASSSPVGATEVDAGSSASLLYRADVDALPDALVYEVQNTFDAPAPVELTR